MDPRQPGCSRSPNPACSPELSFQVAQHVSDRALTPAEVVVLRLMAAGNANKQIADQLAITEDTVKERVKSILAKLDANERHMRRSSA
jgi:DNA-binding NarL/FixJ family response regulator